MAQPFTPWLFSLTSWWPTAAGSPRSSPRVRPPAQTAGGRPDSGRRPSAGSRRCRWPCCSQSTYSSRVVGSQEHQPRPVALRSGGMRREVPEERAAIRFHARMSSAARHVRRDRSIASISCRRAGRTRCGRVPGGFCLCASASARWVRWSCSALVSRSARAMASRTSADTFSPVALFQAGVVRHGSPRRAAPAPHGAARAPGGAAEVRQPHVLRLQPGPPGAQELAELGTPVQGAAGCSSMPSSIRGRTHRA